MELLHGMLFQNANQSDEYIGALLSREYDGIPVLLPFDDLS